jgi:hypothetical protein
MTQRDWQKDMELCKGFLEDSGWSRRDLIADQPQMSMYWLQEAKRLQESLNIAHMAYEGLQEDCVSRGEYAAMLGKLTTMTVSRNEEKARADAAEAREQRLKEAIDHALKWTWYSSEANMTEIDTVLSEVFCTLYPDTPAPKEGEEQ